ncbi:MAG TPA: HAD hydrolase-like protein [Acidimicrobiales bacterium]|nr:HAD hydrolase-like protein [Acidimicrobiales bacterium]
MWPPPPDGTWVIDLDGVIWLTGEPIDGGGHAVESLRRAGIRTLFATNNSSPTRATLHARLRGCGIEVTDDDLLSSADVAAGMLPEGSSAMVLADAGVHEALSRRSVRVVDAGPCDAVVVGWTKALSFEGIDAAARAVRSGARLIGTNEDPTFPTPTGLLPGAGALLAAVATASETGPEVAGKPHQPTVEALRARADDVRVMVGDRPATDGELARRLGVPFGLVLSGVTRAGAQEGGPPADGVAPDLVTLVRTVLELQEH